MLQMARWRREEVLSELLIDIVFEMIWKLFFSIFSIIKQRSVIPT